ncbi:MAG TPA: alginate lyase family protein [Lacipirellula sp.]
MTALLCTMPHARGDEAPATFYWEGRRLAEVKRALEAGSAGEEVERAIELLKAEAAGALEREPRSVIDKQQPPPSGDKHDYISYAVYWWPDPSKPNGKPFIRRDGYTNHAQRAKGDRDRLKTMIEDVESLALANYLFGDKAYGAHARRLLVTWLIDPATRMNPHLRYAQAVVGVTEGRGSGLIDTRGFVELLDSIVLLTQTGALQDADVAALDRWFAEYYEWLLTSEHGRDERRADNNHGTWYAAQVARMALHLHDEPTARELIEEARSTRLAAAIEADGSQPEELERTRSLHYSIFNLAAFAYLACMGEPQGIDLWNHSADGRGSMRQALLFAAPHVLDQQSWPYEEVRTYALNPQAVQLMRMAAARYDEPLFRQVLREGPRSEPRRDWSTLVFALPEE